MSVQPRLILLHQQATSGRVRFLCLPSGVLLFGALPADALLRDETYSPQILIHPAAVVREAEASLALPESAIVAQAGFAAWVASAGGDVPVLLAAFAAIDPPFAAAQRRQGRFIAITESRHLSAVERALLRRAYEHVLG